MLAASFVAAFRHRFLLLLLALCGAATLTSSAPMPESSIQRFTMASPALGRPLAVSVYMPPATPPRGGWPVLYLLHGLGGCERDWVALGGLKAMMDDLIEDDRIRPMMIVMPDGGSSWYVDSAALGGPGNYETALIDELPREIGSRYARVASATSRAIAGVSMGGYGALRLAFKHPDMFAAVASMSGAIWQNLPLPPIRAKAYDAFRDDAYYRRDDVPAAFQGLDLPPVGTHFGKAFGAPFNPERFNAQNVFTILAKQVAKGVTLPPIYLTVGDHDSHNLWRGSIALYQALQADRQNVEFRVTDGDHTWALWRKSIEDALLFVNDSLAAKAGSGPGSKTAVAEAEMGSKSL